MGKWFYEKNNELIDNPEINKKFEEILWMSQNEFIEWMRTMRASVVQLWDEKGLPPRVGFDEAEIVDQFKKLEAFNTTQFIVKDELTQTYDVIRNNSVLGNAANQWFPTMMKTKIAYNKNEGLSIYDHFKEESLFEKTITYAKRHFKRDSFYHYSNPVKSLPKNASQNDLKKNLIASTSAIEWIAKFETQFRSKKLNNVEYDYWLETKEEEESVYTGYNEELKKAKWLKMNESEFNSISDMIPDKCKTNLNWSKGKFCQIRLYEYGQRVFPLGLKAFRISWCQYAVNFPPLTAKHLYEEFTKDLVGKQDVITLWDPSSGWGGRILGAMSIKEGQKYHYIGTDPNTDHNTEKGRTKYHELADFYNKCSYRQSPIINQSNSYEIFQCGSEEMREQERFHEYKGKVDLVFTSPPYFCKEIYSQDANQSCHKFNGYEEWRDGFLRPTLEIAVEWLNNDRYLLWNIADIKLGKDILPLEEDSKKILESLGMKFIKKIKMCLAQMPGGNRIDPDTGEPMAKNFCKVLDRANTKLITYEEVTAGQGPKKKTEQSKEIWFKYEPIFVFHKT